MIRDCRSFFTRPMMCTFEQRSRYNVFRDVNYTLPSLVYCVCYQNSLLTLMGENVITLLHTNSYVVSVVSHYCTIIGL